MNTMRIWSSCTKRLLVYLALGGSFFINCQEAPNCTSYINLTDKDGTPGSGTPNFILCNMSSTATVTGFPNWWGINESSYNFTIPPMSCVGISSNDALKDIYWSTNGSCNLAAKGTSACSYVNVSTDRDSTIAFGEANDNPDAQAWQGIDEITDCTSAVAQVLQCDEGGSQFSGALCGCPEFGSSCASPFYEWACAFACSSGQHSGGEDDDA